MKKILYILAIVISSFAFANTAQANLCYYGYDGSDGRLRFSLRLSNGIVSSLEAFNGYYDKTYHAQYNCTMGSNQTQNCQYWQIADNLNQDSCPEKIYYNQKNGADSVSLNKSTGTIEGHEYELTHIPTICEQADYPCAVCQYSTTYNSALYVVSYKDNQKKLEVFHGMDPQGFPAFSSSLQFYNFQDPETNTLVCPPYLYESNGGLSVTSSDEDKIKRDLNTNNFFENKVEMISPIYTCKYADGLVVMEFDLIGGKVDLHLGNGYSLGISNYQYSDYQGGCPRYEVVCSPGSMRCTIVPNDDVTEGEVGTPVIPYENINDYLAALINPIKAIDSNALDYKIKVNGEEKTLGSLIPNNNICSYSECLNEPQNYLIKGLYETKTYCNKLINSMSSSVAYNDARVDDCMAFNEFYKELYKNGIIEEDLTQGCHFVSNELADKLVWILDLLKIVGPIAALGLGTLDFIKAVASGDADKEMKTAFKRFSTRIIAAVLLFVIPFILAFLMDTFLGNEEGYNPDNPFCNIIEWE